MTRPAAVTQAERVHMVTFRAIFIGASVTLMTWGLDQLGGRPFDYFTVFLFTASGFWLGSMRERDGRSE
jgi:hypothetical protein